MFQREFAIRTMADDENGFRIIAKNRGIEDFTYEREGQWNGPFTFIQSADTQFGMIDDWVNKNQSGPSVEPEVALSTRAIEAINRLTPRPRFMVVCGDLIDAMPGIAYRNDQIRAFKKTFSHLNPDIKLVCVCGNHDVGNYPTVESIDSYRQSFGDDYFSFWVGGVKFLTLNSQYFLEDGQVKKYREEQDRWLHDVLRLDEDQKWKHLIGFQHVPPFIQNSDEELIPVFGNPKLTFNFGDLQVRRSFLTKLQQAGMKKLFCGHYHRNAGGWDGDFEVIVTSAIGMQLGDDKSGIRLVKVMENDVKHRYYALEDIPTETDFQT